MAPVVNGNYLLHEDLYGTFTDLHGPPVFNTFQNYPSYPSYPTSYPPLGHCFRTMTRLALGGQANLGPMITPGCRVG